MFTKTSASVFILFLLLLLLAWSTENWKLFGYFLLVAAPVYFVYASNKKDSARSQRQSTKKEGNDEVDGSEPGENLNEKTSKKPGYIFVQQKITSDGTPTDNYKIDVRSEQDQKPPEVVDCESFSLKLVPRSCKRVSCIIKTAEVISTKLSEYSNDNEGDGWYKLTTQEDFNTFMVVFNDTAMKYR